MALTVELALQKLAAAEERLAEIQARQHDETEPLREVIERLQAYVWTNADHKAETLVRDFVIMRDKRSELKKAYEEEDRKIKDRMEAHDAKLLEMLAEVGADQFKTPYGTAYTQTEVWASVGNWPEYWAHIQATGRFDLLEKRPGQKAIRDMVEAGNPLPPGVTTHRERKVVVRRS